MQLRALGICFIKHARKSGERRQTMRTTGASGPSWLKAKPCTVGIMAGAHVEGFNLMERFVATLRLHESV